MNPSTRRIEWKKFLQSVTFQDSSEAMEPEEGNNTFDWLASDVLFNAESLCS